MASVGDGDQKWGGTQLRSKEEGVEPERIVQGRYQGDGALWMGELV